MVAYTFDPSIQEAERQGHLCELEVIIVYIVISKADNAVMRKFLKTKRD